MISSSALAICCSNIHLVIYTFINYNDLIFRFISWPEFEQCQFRVTMENNLPKFITNLDDDDKEGIATHIEDIEHSDTENET